MSIFLAVVSGTVVIVALPTLVETLETTFTTVQWVLLSFLLVQTTLLPSVGRLGDMLGKKRIYVAGFLVFILGSWLCGLSPNVFWLIGFRIVQGVGAAMTLGLGLALVTEAFPAEERGKALGISGTFVSLGAVLGPTLGGLLVEGLSWSWVFWFNIPIGLVGSAIAIRFIPDMAPGGRQEFDYLGAAVLFIGLLSLLMALTLGQAYGFSHPLIIGLFSGALIMLIIFIGIELRVPQPLIDLTIFRNNLFSIGLVTGWLTLLAVAGTFILFPFYLENVLGYGASQSGLLLAVIPLFIGLTAPVAGALSDRFGTRPIAAIGLVFLVGGYFWLGSLTIETPLWGYIFRLVPIGLGVGIFQSPNNSAIMGSVSKARLGIASGMLAFTRILGQVSGVAMLGAIWTARTLVHQGGVRTGDVTTAPILAQVTGMNDAFMILTILMAIALGLTVWGMAQAHRSPQILPEGV